MRRKWIMSGLIALLLMSLPLAASAAETHVYGDPGSGDFSAAMAVVQDDSSGRVFALGVFFGTFQNIEGSEWDVWMAEIQPGGEMGWVTSWDAPELDGFDFSGLNQGTAAWVAPIADLVVSDEGHLIGTVAAAGGTTVVEASMSGVDEGHTVLNSGTEYSQLVGGEAPSIIGWDLAADPVIRKVGLDGSEEWSVDFWAEGTPGPLMVRNDGSFVAGIQLDVLSFQNAAANVAGFDSSGNQIWETVLNGRCFANGGEQLMALGDELGVLLEPPRSENPSDCDVDKKLVASLNPTTGELSADRTLKDTLNILWCDDPRDGVISDPLETGFTDGDECGGDPVFWTDTNYPLISTGSEVEGLAIVGMEIVNQGYLGFGLLRTEVSGDRWVPAQYEYFAPASGMMPYDMILTDSGPLVVGSAYNTTWIAGDNQTQGQETDLDLAAASTGAAVLVNPDLELRGRFFDDDDSTFEADIEAIAASGVTRGCNPPDNDRFCPEDEVSREQMAAFIVRALGLTDANHPGFSDVAAGSTFEADITKLAKAGITRGCNPPDNDRFCPEDEVSREQMAAFMVRALGLENGNHPGFVDVLSDSTFDSDIRKLANAGITRGCNPPANDRYCPKDNVTREQMAAFMNRAGWGS